MKFQKQTATQTLLVVLMGWFLSGCNESKLKTGMAGEDGGANALKTCDVPLAYESVKAIFQNRCQRCHEAGTRNSVAGYTDIFRIKDKIIAEVGPDFMPDDGPLAGPQKKLMMAWLQAGAPETSDQILVCETSTVDPTPTPMPTPTPTPAPTPVPTGPRTYTELRAQILVPKCLTCHNIGGSAMLYDFTDYRSMISLTDIFDRTNPADSAIVQAVKKVGRGQMPPVRSAIPRLTDAEVQYLQGWIEDGMLE